MLNFWDRRMRTSHEPLTTPRDMERYESDLQKAKLILEGIIEEHEIFGIAKQESKSEMESAKTEKGGGIIVNIINDNNFNVQMNTSFDQML